MGQQSALVAHADQAGANTMITDSDNPTAAVLDLLIGQHPALLHVDELVRLYARDSIAHHDAARIVGDAISELLASGLAHRLDRFVFASRAALRGRRFARSLAAVRTSSHGTTGGACGSKVRPSARVGGPGDEESAAILWAQFSCAFAGVAEAFTGATSKNVRQRHNPSPLGHRPRLVHAPRDGPRPVTRHALRPPGSGCRSH